MVKEKDDIGRAKRILVYFVLAVAIEAGLVFLSHMTPAVAGLLRPVYIAVALLGLVAMASAWRRRPGSDRRQDERRDGSAER